MSESLRLALPKGRMQDSVLSLLADAGFDMRTGSRSYRPTLTTPGYEVKILKPHDIIEMLHVGSRDLGLAGADWVSELNAELVEVLDTGLDTVRLVAAAPRSLLVDGLLPDRNLVVASEYEQLSRRWLEARGQPYTFVSSRGATEVFPPEDADLIVDNTATGSTLAANDLVIVDEVMRSSTRLYASKAAWADPERRARIEDVGTLIGAVLEARKRVMLEVNVPRERLEDVVALLPCMREPTVSPLHGAAGFAIKAAVPRRELPGLIPNIKANGGTDIVVSRLLQIVP
ncbi:MAG: ATP phosphoribosyltransferase [Planctomycetota bacterium]